MGAVEINVVGAEADASPLNIKKCSREGTQKGRERFDDES
jgi:hypothetical protein